MVKAKRPASTASVSDQKEFELPARLTVNDFLFLYEFKMRQAPLLNLDTWPKVTPQQALDLIGETTIDEMYEGNSSLATSHRKCEILLSPQDENAIDIEKLKKAMFDKDCILAYAIPLVFWAVGKGRDTDLLHLVCIYNWASYIKYEINTRLRKQHNERRENDPNIFCFLIEANIEQAVILDHYRKAKVIAYDSWNEKLRKTSIKKTLPEPSSQYITALRKKIGGDVPRSIVTRGTKACNAIWDKWIFKGKKGPMPTALVGAESNQNFSIGTGFKLRAASIDVGSAKNIHVSEMISGEYNPSRSIKYAIIERTEGLIYRVYGKYSR
ncbi:hypothetical protein YOLOSWAG_212 [Erwinia phage vB_EamM_Yoloswag]|uniref:Uncharacterized protein n=1 Tax=Erwinia phage vB_EamM_Yoloswag TaxID=1958956 RepID=A0A1S6L3E0_9CAUD|nr:hypothetical protein HOR66_gp212 [Erwinia phage vB_EamM_Yoloswag]AQT28690.1 hypothetical protein YOLOSWAG_212 [Erwinia phage vB_EamM_Yoloswag]